jgi:predicted MFS family arabinose efflux permease
VGPALGGIVIALTSSGVAFLFNAVSFFGVILFLYHWKPTPREPRLAATTFSGAVAVGLRYVRQARRIRAVLVRTAVFSLFASSFWALLPLIASRFGAAGYGGMLAFFGLGALAGAFLLARAHHSFSFDRVLLLATLVFAVALCGLVRSSTLVGSSAFAAAAGLGWISILATLNFVVQISCPAWVRARVISMYVLVLQGGLALGSALWGMVASRAGIKPTLTLAAAALVAGLLLGPWYRLQQSDSLASGKEGIGSV